MKIGDWVYCKHADVEFQIVEILGEFAMEDAVIGYLKKNCEVLETEECRKCHKQVPQGQVQQRYSYGVYAGRMCEGCAISGYRDQCGLSGAQGNPQDLDEELEPEPYYGMERYL